MTDEEIKKEVLKYKWEVWIDRPFGAFYSSLGKGGNSRTYMRKAGVDAELPASLFQKGNWYQSEEVWQEFDVELESHLKNGGNIFDVVKHCESCLTEGKERIRNLESSSSDNLSLFNELFDTLTQLWSHIWLAHGFEHLYVKRLRAEVPKYMAGEVEKNIGDISFPTKKNAHNYFVEALKSDVPLKEVQEKYAWIKARGGFVSGYTIEELAEERERLKSETKENHEFVRPHIPEEISELATVAQELVYYRTLRTDVCYELMWLARPLMKKIAEGFGLTFDELRDYSAIGLLEGKKQKFEFDNFSAMSFGAEYALFQGKVLKDSDYKTDTVIKGAVAFKGVVTGKAKIVRTAHEICKVEVGDILVAPTTAPSFIIGMQRAVAFVTDEGGITSHASIVSREMKKPCIIGTKIATKVLKDGDEVEVNANEGTVKILKRAT